MKKNNIAAALKTLNTKDTMSLLLFILHRLSKDPQYAILSDLVYLLDNDSLFRLFDYYEGVTITIPTKTELLTMIDALLLYQYTKIDNMEMSEALKEFNEENIQLSDIKEAYYKILEVVQDYKIKGTQEDAKE